MREKAKFLPVLAGAFLGTYGVSYLMNLRGGVEFSYSVFTLLLMGALAVLLGRLENSLREITDRKVLRRRVAWGALLSLFFGVLMIAGYQLQWLGYTEPGFRGKARLLLRGACVAIAVFPFANAIFAATERLPECKTVSAGKKWRKPIVFMAGWFGIWLCWIPVWLAYYPVIMSYDFHKQSLEALLGLQYFNNHHPLAHTFLIWLFRNLGEALGSYETGYAWFSLFQQMIVSAVLGYACVMVYRLTGRKWATVLSGLFFGLFPLVSVFVMCTTKDVLFGAFFVLFILLFVERVYFVGSSQTAGKRRAVLTDVLWVLSGILMMLFRNNALYAMMLFGILYLILCGRRERLRAFILTALLIVGGKGTLTGLQAGFHAHFGSDIEKYSVIYQSMARVGQRQLGNLSPETYALLDNYVTQECWESYNPPLADTIKAAVQKTNMNERKSWDDMGRVFSAWVKIGLQYPNEYMDAFLDLTRGYWFPDDTSHAEMLGVGLEERMGLLYTYNSAAEESLPGMRHISKFPWLENQLEKLLSANEYYRYPVISGLFKPAFWCWLLLLCTVCFMYTRQRKKLLISLYPICYFATMLLGPTAIVRYIFPILLLAPVLLALLCYNPHFR